MCDARNVLLTQTIELDPQFYAAAALIRLTLVVERNTTRMEKLSYPLQLEVIKGKRRVLGWIHEQTQHPLRASQAEMQVVKVAPDGVGVALYNNLLEPALAQLAVRGLQHGWNQASQGFRGTSWQAIAIEVEVTNVGE